MKILLDTTYFLPAIGVSVKGIPNDFTDQLIMRGDKIFMSQISLFELSAKGARYIIDGNIPPERVARGVSAISYDDAVTKLVDYEPSTLRLAFKFRTILRDFIDCLILAGGALHCEVLVTEDDDIHRARKEKVFEEYMTVAGSKCRVVRAAEVMQ